MPCSREMLRRPQPEPLPTACSMQLPLAVAPTVPQRCGVRGGAALNLLVQDSPRLSADIGRVVFVHGLSQEDAAHVMATNRL
jgi:hypothetical protein